jgi:hypothetical protein
MKRLRALALLAALVTPALAADAAWCLSMTGLGAIRTGMTVEQVLPLADWSGLERGKPAEGCWYLRYEGPDSFALMIIDNRVARIELGKKSRLHTFAGARIGTSEDDLKKMYGARLEAQPHKYVEGGHNYVLRSGAGNEGLRFEVYEGVVQALQGGPWEHLNYVEGCS